VTLERGVALCGTATGVIDEARTEAVSEVLRDDSRAFNHAAVGYAVPHTTAYALGGRPARRPSPLPAPPHTSTPRRRRLRRHAQLPRRTVGRPGVGRYVLVVATLAWPRVA
jgi:hypothetical protein